MPTFTVKGRKTNALTTVTVEADSRDAAIAQVVATAEEGEEFDVMEVTEVPADVPAPKR
jgi:hypothetical protein